MILNTNNTKMKHKKLYIIIAALFFLVILLNNRDYIEKNINNENNKVLEHFANNNNKNSNSSKKKMKQLKNMQFQLEKLKDENNNITNKYLDLKKKEQNYYNNVCKQSNDKTDDKEDPQMALDRQQKKREDKKALESKRDDDMNIIYGYNKTANDYLDYQKNKGPEINLLDIGKDIEDGIYTLTDKFSDYKKKIMDPFNGKFKSYNNVESFVNKTNKMQKGKQWGKQKGDKIKEGFVVSEEEDVVSEEEVLGLEEVKTKEIKERFYLENNRKKDVNESGDEGEGGELDEDLLSYFTYVFENIYSLFKKYFNLYINKNDLFNLGNMSKDSNTLIGGGILFIVISMGLYFIDISS
jgi:hypothetical protein